MFLHEPHMKEITTEIKEKHESKGFNFYVMQITDII